MCVIALTRMATTTSQKGLLDEIRPNDKQVNLRTSSPPDGKYILRGVFTEFPERGGEFASIVQGKTDDGCILHIMLESADSRFFTLVTTVDHYFYDLNRHMELPRDTELTIVGGSIVYNYMKRNPDWDILNKLSPYRSEFAKSRTNVLDALGAHHLVELSPNKTYTVADVSAFEDENPTTGATRGYIFVSLVSKKGPENEEDSGESSGLLIYFNRHNSVEPALRRTYRFFESRLGTQISPKMEIPTVIKTDDFDRLFSLITSEEPKLKKGELYVLDSVEKRSNRTVVLRAHHISDHPNFDLRYIYPNGIMTRVGGPFGNIAEQLRTGEQAVMDPALKREDELTVAERRSSIAIELETYADNERPRSDSLTYLRRQDDLYHYFKSFEESYTQKEMAVVFSVTVDVYNASLDFMEAPQTSGKSPFVFDRVSLSDVGRLERISRAALSYREFAAGRIN